MAYNITDACVKCGSCADNCPVEAISEGEDKYVIDADVCVSCGSCMDNCPYELDIPRLLKENYEDYKNILSGKTKV